MRATEDKGGLLLTWPVAEVASGRAGFGWQEATLEVWPQREGGWRAHLGGQFTWANGEVWEIPQVVGTFTRHTNVTAATREAFLAKTLIDLRASVAAGSPAARAFALVPASAAGPIERHKPTLAALPAAAVPGNDVQRPPLLSVAGGQVPQTVAAPPLPAAAMVVGL